MPPTIEDLHELATLEAWHVRPGPWLFGQSLRILIVLDGGISLTRNFFGIGIAVDALRERFAWWARLTVDVANREGGGGPEYAYSSFRFDQPGFVIDSYDQVWFFGFNPGNGGELDDTLIAQANPLSGAELKIVADWMHDRRGGVFATGDHHFLGASMCSRIPRVRSMRRWTNAQGVPPAGGPTRIDTNQPATPAQVAGAYMPFANQGDEVPQPIEPVYRETWSWSPFVRNRAPHPLLCTPAGVITRFPDHPHEGEVLGGADVVAGVPLGIPGFTHPEYPGAARPEVIAHGRSTHLFSHRVKGPVIERRFGLLGVYDGDPVGIGRVVVDSTWHHWFSENLTGFQAGDPAMLDTMKDFFRNVALWLATPQQRATMLTYATWGVLTGSGPMVFPPTTGVWELGGRALDVIGRTVSACLLRDWVLWFLPELPVRFTRPELPEPWPCLSCPPLELFERAIVGGLAKGMLPIAFEYQKRLARGERALVEPAAIAKGASRGVALGRRELTTAIRRGAAGLAALEGAAAAGDRTAVSLSDAETTPVRVVVEALQSADVSERALLPSSTAGRLVLWVNDLELATTELPELGAVLAEGTGPVRVDREFEVVLQQADVMKVELWLHDDPTDAARSRLAGHISLAGGPAEVVGRRLSDADAGWRFAVQVERGAVARAARGRRR